MEHFKIGENLEKDMKYCICREPWNRTKMIGCDFCEEWYHIACLSLKRSDVQKLKNIQWKCPKCKLSDSQKSQFDNDTIKLNFACPLIEMNDEILSSFEEEGQKVMKSGGKIRENDVVILDDFEEKIENNSGNNCDQFAHTTLKKQFICIEQETPQNVIESKTKDDYGNLEVILDNSDDEIENNGFEIVGEKIICIEQEKDQKEIKLEATNRKCEVVILDDSDKEIENEGIQLVCQLFEKNENLIKMSSNGLDSPDSEKSREIRRERERQIRLEQRNYMAFLKTQVPEIADMNKPSKLTILRKAIDYCHFLSNMDSQIRKDQAKELARNQMLKKKFKNSIFALKRQKILFICKDAII